jgi:ABC-type multidrug transport system fused ATPase/permease subunit
VSALPRPLGGGRGRGVALVAGLGVAEAAAIGVAAVATRDVFAALHDGAGPPVAALAVLAAAGAGVALLRAGSRTLAEALGQRYAMALRRALYRQLARLPASAVERRRAGAVGLRFVGDLSAARRWLSLGITRLASGAVVLPGAALALWWLDPRLALAAGPPVAASLVVMAGLALVFGRLHRRLRSGRARLAIDMMERAAVAPELDLLGRTSRELDRLDRAGRTVLGGAVRRAAAARLLHAVPEIGAALAGVLLLWEAARAGLPAAEAAGALAVLAILALPLRDLAGVRDAHAAWGVARAKLADVLAAPGAERGRPLRGGPCALRLGATRLAPGEVAAIEAGPRATALIAAAAGLEPSVDVTTEERERPPLAAHVGPRSPVLQGSLRRALTMGARRRPDDAALERLARGFGLGRLIDAGGLDLRVGEGGRTLHEGERLRALLLRAALREPDLLLIDRPDAAADPEAVALIGRIARETGATALVALPKGAPTPHWAHARLDAEARALRDPPAAARIARGAAAPASEEPASGS